MAVAAVQASEQEQQEEERRLLHAWRWDRSVGDSIRLAAEVKQLLMESTRTVQREAHMAWRLARWALRHARQQLLEVCSVACSPLHACCSKTERARKLDTVFSMTRVRAAADGRKRREFSVNSFMVSRR